jgi:hypothetical protein
MANFDDSRQKDHLYAVLFRESKIIISKYEDYLKEKISSKELAQKMLSLRDAIKRIEESK